MEMMKKMDMRKKALMASMKDDVPMEAMMQKKMMPPGMEEDGEEQGFEQMMVSPKEKKMLLEMRGQGEGMSEEDESGF